MENVFYLTPFPYLSFLSCVLYRGQREEEGEERGILRAIKLAFIRYILTTRGIRVYDR